MPLALSRKSPVITAAELLLKAWEMKAMDRPSDRDYRSVLHYLEADGGQLYEAEMDYICEEEDLVTLRPGHGSGRGHGWLDVLAETFLLRFRCKPLTVCLPVLSPVTPYTRGAFN